MTTADNTIAGERSPRRVVTGHDAAGRSIVLHDTQLPMVPGAAGDRHRLAEIWATVAPESADTPARSAIRIVAFPPGERRDMHRTDTVDYGIVLAGELYLILEQEETLLRTGDVVVQRGTRHGWQNRAADTVARIAFINLGGQVDDKQRIAPG